MMLNNTLGTTRIEDADETVVVEAKNSPENLRVTANFHPQNGDTEYLIDPESSVGMLILKPRPPDGDNLGQSNSASFSKNSPNKFMLQDMLPKDSHAY